MFTNLLITENSVFYGDREKGGVRLLSSYRTNFRTAETSELQENLQEIRK